MKLLKAATPVPGPIMITGTGTWEGGIGFGSFMVPLVNQRGIGSDVFGSWEASQVEQRPLFFLLNLVSYSVTAMVKWTSPG